MHEQHTMVTYNDFVLYPVLCLREPDAISNLKTPVYCVTAFVGFSFFFYWLFFPPSVTLPKTSVMIIIKQKYSKAVTKTKEPKCQNGF